MGFYESFLAMRLVQFLLTFVEQHALGIVAGAAGMLRLAPGRVRIPDVSFISWDRLPSVESRDNQFPTSCLTWQSRCSVKAILRVKWNRNCKYFTAGVRLVWYVDPVRQEVHVYTATDQHEVLTADHTLHGGEVLPGFTLLVRQLFAEPTESPDHHSAL